LALETPDEKNQPVFLVTGGAGFIGSHLIDSLPADAATREIRVLGLLDLKKALPQRKDAKDDLRLPKDAKP